MKFNLCYKSYEFKMNLAAMKSFKEATGKDLWSTLTEFIYIYNTSRQKQEHTFVLMKRLSEVCDFIDSAHALHSMAKQCNSKLPIEEIEDAMFHAGWRPGEDMDSMNEPYGLVMFQVALSIDDYFKELSTKKRDQDS